MEDLTAVCFTVEPIEPAKRSRFGRWRFFVTEQVLPVKTGENGQSRIRQIMVRFPRNYRKRKAWTREALAEYQNSLPIPPQSGTVCYLYEKEARGLLRRQQEPAPYPWLQGMLEYYKAVPDNLIILEDGDMETEDLILRYVKKARTVSVVTEKPEEMEELRERLSQEYGLLLRVWDRAGSFHIPPEGNNVFVAGRALYGLKPAMLPPGSLFICTDRGEGQKLCGRAEGVRYVDTQVFLRDCGKPSAS